MFRRFSFGPLCLLVFQISSPAADLPELQELRAKIAAQQEQIQHLQQSVNEQQKLLERALQVVEASATAPAATAPAATASTDAPVKLVNAVNRQNRDIVNLPRAMQGGTEKSSPLSVSIGNTTFTPLGFMDATFFARSTNVGSGIGTNFAGVPLNNQPTGHLSEANFSAQNSRLGVRVDSTFMGAKVLGYLEADFLFNNNSNGYQITSNSAGFRLRNYFVDLTTKNGFEFMGGQDWSLLTPNRKGLSPLPSDLFYTQDMDTNYQVGLTWTRAPQFRFISHPNENFAFGVAFENPQQYIGGGAGASTVTLPSNLNGTFTLLNTQFQANGQPLSIPNWFPDIIFKGAYDGSAGGKVMHVEAAGLVRGFKDYIPASVPSAMSGNHSAVGFGGSVNANLEIIKNVRLIANTFFSDGGGRYIFGIAPDVVVRPNGTISPLHAYSTLDGVEAQVSKNTLLAAYYGGAYVGKNIAFDPTTSGSTLAKPVYIGYGTPTGTQNRAVQEITFDWVQTLWKNPNYGALSLINEYSYVWRNLWAVTPSNPKGAHTNMVYVNLRYTLP
jgi:hypothetical protein